MCRLACISISGRSVAGDRHVEKCVDRRRARCDPHPVGARRAQARGDSTPLSPADQERRAAVLSLDSRRKRARHAAAGRQGLFLQGQNQARVGLSPHAQGNHQRLLRGLAPSAPDGPHQVRAAVRGGTVAAQAAGGGRGIPARPNASADEENEMNAHFARLVVVPAELGAIPMLLAKITLLLAAAWLVQAALGRLNPRWRVLVWRVTGSAIVLLCVLAISPPFVRLAILPGPTPELAAGDAANPATSLEDRAELLDPIRRAPA